MTAIPEIDIQGDAARILGSACAAVKAALERGKDGPLVILAAETHTFPAHIVHHMAVIEKLRAAGKPVAVTCERPHNRLQHEFFRAHNAAPDAAQTKFMRQQDATGTLSLKTDFVLQRSDYAPYTGDLLHAHLLKQNISTRFTDAATSYGLYTPGSVEMLPLDASDASTRDSLSHALPAPLDRADYLSSEGAEVRNHHMAKLTFEFLRKTRADFVMQQCGRGHAEDIAARLKEKGVNVLCLIPTGEGLWLPRPQPALHDRDRLLLPSLSTTTAAYDGRTGDPVEGWPGTLVSQADEADYTNALLGKTGLENACLTVSAAQKLRQQYFDDMTRFFFEDCPKPATATPRPP